MSRSNAVKPYPTLPGQRPSTPQTTATTGLRTGQQKRKKFGTRYHFLHTTQFEPHYTVHGCEYTIFGDSCRVTLVVPLAVIPKFWEVAGTCEWYFIIL